MMKKITVQDIMEKSPREGWTEEMIRDKIGSGKTLLQISRMWSVAAKDRIWCITRFLSDDQNRRFVIWCAHQCKADNALYSEEDWAADSAADMAYMAADSEAYRAADSAEMRKKQLKKLRELIKEED